MRLWPVLLLFIVRSVWALPPTWPPHVPGHLLPPFFRHVGLMPMGDPKLSAKLWKNFDGVVTMVVVPIEELSSGEATGGLPKGTKLHFFVDAGKWELSTNDARLKLYRERFPKTGWTGGWVFNGDVGSMVTNLREFAGFRKELDSIRNGALTYLSCPSRVAPQSIDDCLPKSLRPFFHGVIWDLHFKNAAEAKCLTQSASCRAEAEDFFEAIKDSEVLADGTPAWSLRVPLMALAQLGDPLKLLKALYARFINENYSVHLLLGVDDATIKKVLANEAPYVGVKGWLQSVTEMHLARNADLGINLETQFLYEGDPQRVETTKLVKGGGVEASFRKPFVLTRFSAHFDPKRRPTRLKVYVGDGEGEYYVKRFAVTPPGPGERPSAMYTETLFFPRVTRLVVIPEGGALKSVSAMGWTGKK